MAATLEITAHRGSLWIQPESLTGFLKPHLQYWHKYTPNKIVSYLDKETGQMVETEVRGNKVKTVKVNLYVTEGNYLVIHEGLLLKVFELCAQNRYEVNYKKNDPQFPEPIANPSIVRGLMPDQIECVIKMLEAVSTPTQIGGGGALVECTMGAGKTYVIAGLCRAYRTKIIVTTRSKAVVERLHRGLRELLAPDGITVGKYQGSTREDGDVIVITIALLSRLDRDDVNVLIFDECHHAAGNETAVEVQSFTQAVKFGLSATINDRFDGKEALLQAIFGPVVYTLTDQEAEDLGRVVPIKAYAIQVTVGPNTNSWKSPVTKERNAIWRNIYRNKAIQDAAEAVPADQQLVVFVSTKEHGEILQKSFLKGYEFYHGSLSDALQKPMLAAFESGELKRMIATDSIGEGVDPQDLMVVIDTNWKSSKIQVPQRAGRNRRHGNDKAWGVLITFQDDFDDTARRKSNERLQQYRQRGYQVTLIAHPSSIEFVSQAEPEENERIPSDGPGEPTQGCLPGIP